MIIDETQNWLETLSIEDLDKVIAYIDNWVTEKDKAELEQRNNLSLRSKPDEIADAYGLDISGLMRDINKWK